MKYEDVDIDHIISVVESTASKVDSLCDDCGLLSQYHMGKLMGAFFESVKDDPLEEVTSILFAEILVEEDTDGRSERMNLLTILYVRASFLLSRLRDGEYVKKYRELLYKHEYESVSYLIEHELIQYKPILGLAKELEAYYLANSKISTPSPYFKRKK